MNRNQKEAMIAGLELAERAHVAEMAQARALLEESLAHHRIHLRAVNIMNNVNPTPEFVAMATKINAHIQRLKDFLK